MRTLKTLILFAVAWASQAQAQTPNDPVLESTMRTYNLSEADARAQLSSLAEANRVGNRLEVDEPTRYAGLRIDRGQNLIIHVRLVGAADNILSKYTNNPAFVAEKARSPLRALKNKQQAIIHALAAHEKGYGVSLDAANGQIRVTVPDEAEVRGKLRAGGLVDDDVVIEHADSFIEPAVTEVGGFGLLGRYWSFSDGTGSVRDTATLGFIVKNSAGTRGVLTAAHFDECKFSKPVTGCTVNNPATDAQTSATLNFKGQQLGNDLDYEWRTSSANTFTNQIYYGAYMSITQVLDARSYQAGTLTVCKMGKTTGYTCGTVADCNQYATDPTYGIAGYFCRVSNNAGGYMADSGDSGGPVFASATAFGVVNAKITGGSYIGQMTFMPIQKISGLGLSILTTP